MRSNVLIPSTSRAILHVVVARMARARRRFGTLAKASAKSLVRVARAHYAVHWPEALVIMMLVHTMVHVANHVMLSCAVASLCW